MSRYIDAEQIEFVTGGLDESSELDYVRRYVIDRIPTADVQEVRRGRWILDENPHDGDCRCSVCGVVIDAMNERNHEMLNTLTGDKWWTFYRYCPKCGSKMDLEKDE